ncbi:hypothetical protein OO306_12005 [Pseudomonas sp. DCB_AW]|uniref:hypothetical protein n=1 Tax=Pseudomonas sp. DCB_AW TaxID=2993596 RepID=UPI002248EA5C|nr:hypothetical protein [Pseudomonas sp. DCB_AW]MCX2686268.1 hypothetical protein [Pseudomonas sp. DCB_AW]
MIFEEHFTGVVPQFLRYQQPLDMPSGLTIHSNSTSWSGFEAFKGEDGTELVIGEHSEVQIAFTEEVESLWLEYYVVRDFPYDNVHMLFDAQNHYYDMLVPAPRNFYWLTVEGNDYPDLRPGPIVTQPCEQVIDGPFRRLTISTSQAGTVHIRKLEWTGTRRQ